MPEPGGVVDTLLAFDFGTERIGVAVGNTLTASARALTVLAQPSSALRFEAIARLVTEWQPTRLVVGRPLHPDGQTHELTTRCERFARQLGGRHGLPVTLVDERYSSVEASRALAPGQRVDSEAAAVILRQYLHESTRS
jgi:putative Holliday junction resolvase